MSTYTNSYTTARTLRRVSAEAIAHYATTSSQAARLAALGGAGASRAEPPTPLWDGALLDRLTAPLSRIRE